MTNPTIPPAALEAAAKEIAMTCRCAMACDWRDHVDDARAACLAMLKAWPGMSDIPSCEADGTRYPRVIHLPLTENTNDKA